MDDLKLQASLDDFTTLTVSSLDDETYSEFVDDDSLGGSAGYFVLRSSKTEQGATFEVLAKAPTFEAAGSLFNLIVRSQFQPKVA